MQTLLMYINYTDKHIKYIAKTLGTFLLLLIHGSLMATPYFLLDKPLSSAPQEGEEYAIHRIVNLKPVRFEIQNVQHENFITIAENQSPISVKKSLSKLV